jgi:hypothetical protein
VKTPVSLLRRTEIALLVKEVEVIYVALKIEVWGLQAESMKAYASGLVLRGIQHLAVITIHPADLF